MDAELVAWREQVGVCADSQLMAELRKLVRADRCSEVRVLICLGELDERGLALEQAHSSLFGYATGVLRMSEAQAYLRIQAARLARRYPVILEMLVRGELNLSTLKLLDRHLTADNHVALLERARNKTKRDVELLIAEIAPQPDLPTRMRKLPVRSAPKQTTTAGAHVLSLIAQKPSRSAPGTCGVAQQGSAKPATVAQISIAETSVASPGSATPLTCGDASSAASVAAGGEIGLPVTFALEAPRASCTPSGPGRFRLQMTASQELHDKLKQLQHLLRHQVPGGDLDVIIERAVDLLLERTTKQRFAQVAKPRSSVRESHEIGIRARVAAATAEDAPTREPVDAEPARLNETRGKEARSRYIPRAVVREVFARDGAQCTFLSASGQRCTERGRLELHHIRAFALGGTSTVENLTVVCRSHNGLYAAQDFGTEHMRMKRAPSRPRGDQSVLF